jgi:hypothetical protein
MRDCQIKFFVADYRGPAVSGYQHELVALAEGFRELGISYCGNANYWMDEKTGNYLIESNRGNQPFEVNIFHERFIAHFSDWNKYVDKTKINILIDAADGFYNTPCHDRRVVTSFDWILKTHYNRSIRYPKNVKPWAFGLTNRIISVLENFESKAYTFEILNNFSPGLSNHSLRVYLNDLINLGDNPDVTVFQSKRLFQEYNENGYLTLPAQTGIRHDEEYYTMLNRARFTLAYGGFFCFRFLVPFSYIFKHKTHGVNHRLENFYKNFSTKRSDSIFLVNQFDSWRWWEALYSQSVPIHLDFEKHGFLLPENPVPGVHYLAIDMDDEHFTTKEVTAEDQRKMALLGKNWAFEHYSPAPTASRFMGWVSKTV